MAEEMAAALGRWHHHRYMLRRRGTANLVCPRGFSGIYSVGYRFKALVVGFAAAFGAAGCSTLPQRTGLNPEGALGPGETDNFPNLADIPARPAAAATPEVTADIVRSLAADRALTAQAGASLRQEIETSFTTPEPER